METQAISNMQTSSDSRSNNYKTTRMPALNAPKAIPWVLFSTLFSLFYFVPLISSWENLGLQKVAIVVGIYCTFLAVYYIAVRASSDKILGPIIFLIALCVGATYITPGTNALIGYPMFVCAYHLRLSRAAIFLVLTLSLDTFVFISFHGEHSDIFLTIAGFLTIALFFNGALVRKDVLHKIKEEKSQAEIEQLATIAERERISRDLHDLLGHSLSSIALKAELASKLCLGGDASKAADEISQVAQLSREALSQVRQSVSGFLSKGLNQELKNIVSGLESAGFSTELSNTLIDALKHSAVEPILSARLESNIVLLLTEASTNIIRHSNGNQAKIELSRINESIHLSIYDNGITTQCTPGNGIDGMQQRCDNEGGVFKISHESLTHNNSGTLVTIQLPSHRAN